MRIRRTRLQRTAVLAAAAAVGIVIAGGSAARAADPSTDDLREQLRVLQSKVQELEAKQQQPSKADVDATVAGVLKDADHRSKFMGDMPLAGNWQNGKFTLESGDGKFVLHPWLQFQFRNTTNFRENGKASGSDDFQNGFEVRRMKLGFDGNAFSKDLTYLFNWATNRKTGALELEEAWAQYMFAGPWGVQAGQIKDPFAHESLVSSKKLLAAERSLLTDLFTGGDNFVQGVALLYKPKDTPLTAAVAFTDGARNNFNQNFQDFPTNNADYGAAGRVEYYVFGNRSDYEDFSARGNKQALLVFGGGADWTEAGNTDFLLHTADVQYEGTAGLGAYAAYYGRYTKNSPVNPTPGATGPITPPATQDDLYDWGFLVQASYALDNHWEPFVRYDFINFDSDGIAAGAENEVHEITAGVNYYVYGHNAKFTVDVMYLPNGSPVNDDGSGVLANADNEFVIRAQFQLLL